MNNSVRLSSSICKYGLNPPANLCKYSFPYSSKPLLANLSNSQNRDHKRYSQTSVDNESENKNSPFWHVKDGGHFNKGFGIAGFATAISVSAMLYYKYKKGIKAESGKSSL